MLGGGRFFLECGFADLGQLNDLLFDVAAWWQVDPFALAERSLDQLVEARDHAQRINKLRQEANDG